jgi:hypothetical protein
VPGAGEVWAYPEGTVYVYAAAAGQTGSPLAFVQDVELGLSWEWRRTLSPASAPMRERVSYDLIDAPVEWSFRAYFTALSLVKRAMSATAINADFQLMSPVVADHSAAFRCLSGRFDRVKIVGQELGIWEAQVSMQFAEISAYWGA